MIVRKSTAFRPFGSITYRCGDLNRFPAKVGNDECVSDFLDQAYLKQLLFRFCQATNVSFILEIVKRLPLYFIKSSDLFHFSTSCSDQTTLHLTSYHTNGFHGDWWAT